MSLRLQLDDQNVVDPWQIVDEYQRSREYIVAAVGVLRSDGVPVTVIAKRMGLSREGVHAIIRRGKVAG